MSRQIINRRTFVGGLAATGVATLVYADTPKPPLNVGLELYSLREDMKRDVPGTLTRVRSMGFRTVEVPGLYGLTSREFRLALDKAGLKATAFVAQYDRLEKDMPQVQQDLRTLGARWAILPWIPHGDQFERADVDRASKAMNAWGAALESAGFKFACHPHGYEFRPAPEGTLFDVLAASTHPGVVSFQLDTFWIVRPGQDCVKLMKRYPDRFRLLHLKDLRQGAETGSLTGQAPEADSVVLGDGVVPWKDVLRLAREQKVEAYYIEDESQDAANQIPRSLQFLSKLRL